MVGVLLMTKETFGERLKRLRETRRLSKYRLAKDSGINETYIYQLEADVVTHPRSDTLMALARQLNVSLEELAGGEPLAERPLRVLFEEVSRRYDAIGLLELPIKTTVPSSYPYSPSGQGYIQIPRSEVTGVSDMDKLYALKVMGDGLAGDGINSGDFLVVEPTTNVIDGKLYIVRLGEEVCARHVYKHNKEHLRLVASNGEAQEVQASDVEIQGRVVLLSRKY